ncbi:MAG: hypothetical protein HC907_30790 [Richelia sp. SM1_7_0]|nr:hypothetical protein [Richelia sp. SM1_7_0]
MNKTFQKLLEVRKVLCSEITKLPKSSVSERCILELLLENIDQQISLLKDMV